MEELRVRFFRCPYCGTGGKHGKTVNKQMGWFRIKELYNNVLILECKQCLKVCRKMTVGKTLQWQDMSAEEKKVFKKKSFKAYTKSTEVKK